MNPGDVTVEIAGCALGVEPAAEVAGTVVAAGEAAQSWLGRRVVVPRVLPCGDCAVCRRGRAAVCPSRAARSGLGEHETVPARFLCSVEPPLWPKGLPDEDLWRLAALADAAAAPFGALLRAGIAPGDTLAVVGEDARAGFARAIAVAKGATLVDGRATVVLDCTGESAMGRLVPGGTLVMLDRGTPRFLPEATLICASACHPDLYPELCALAARGELPLIELTHALSSSESEAPKGVLGIVRRR